MKTFCVHTLGCKVNHYESEQIASLLRARGLSETDAARADLRVINTCSVTVEASAKSRQATRRFVRLPVLDDTNVARRDANPPAGGGGTAGCSLAQLNDSNRVPSSSGRARVIVTGCWATSDPAAAALPGVDAVLTHHGDVAAELNQLLDAWRKGDTERQLDRQSAGCHPLAPLDLTRQDCSPEDTGRSVPAPREDPAPAAIPIPHAAISQAVAIPPEPFGNEGWMIGAGSPAGAATDARTRTSKAESIGKVNAELDCRAPARGAGYRPRGGAGTTRLPLLGEHQSGRQRAVLKVQDGCDAHCTYCIIPALRPVPWSKPVDDVVDEARRLVAAGHVEIILTGIFLGAYGQPTALRRRQPARAPGPLGELVRALCTRVPGLRRLRLSSLEPGDMTHGLLAVLRDHAAIVPHFHLPLQSGSDALLRRMNRQYGRDDFLRMTDRVDHAFDRPAITTDVIVGFPGETDAEFARTLEVVDHARFVHVHAFPFSPRPGTAAARWRDQFVPGPLVNQRMDVLRARSRAHGLAFRRQFLGRTVEVLVEDAAAAPRAAARHGRCERYFDVRFDDAAARPGDFLTVRVDDVADDATFGTCLGPAPLAAAPHA
jgi:MiaB/RimO family radical SAM methylthiotransferase